MSKMRSKKLIAFLIIAIFLLTSFLPNIVAEESSTDQNDLPDQNDTLFDRFFKYVIFYPEV